MPPHPLTNFEIQKYLQNEPEPKFNDTYSKKKKKKEKKTNIIDGTYAINSDEYESIGTHWIALYVHSGNVTKFDSFGVRHSKRN